jgi:hypothetical protein
MSTASESKRSDTMDKVTQRAKILDYCDKHGSITVREAFDKLNINSPTKVFSVMRHSPKYIVTEQDEVKVNKEGETKRYKRYFIEEARV